MKKLTLMFLSLLLATSALAAPAEKALLIDQNGREIGTVDNPIHVSGTSGGTGGGASDAADVTYNNPTYPNVEAALDFLIIGAPSIVTFTNNKNSLENGTTVTSTILNWTISGAITSESLDNSIGALSPTSIRTKTHTSTYSTNRTYTLTVSDGSVTDTATTLITFKNTNYWGPQAATTLTDGQINALSSALATSRIQTRTITASNQHIHFFYPASYGTATFTVNGFLNDDFTCANYSTHINASGASVSYTGCYTNNTLTGTYTIEVQ